MRRDDGAGFLETAQFQRDRGTNDRGLPLERDRQIAHPAEPMFAGLVQELPAGRSIALRKIVRAEDQIDRASEREVVSSAM